MTNIEVGQGFRFLSSNIGHNYGLILDCSESNVYAFTTRAALVTSKQHQ
jgi:hypothetical protein